MTPTGVPPQPADTKRKTWTFNPPPGWPTPPGNWKPEAGWRPDPSWPPAPPGWEFWRPTSRDKQRGISFYVKAMAGVITFAATIIGTYVAVKGQPPKFTTADWEHQANATCDQDAGGLSLSIFNGLASPALGEGNTSTQSTFASKVGALVGAAGSLSKLVGDLAALQTPKDGGAPEVQAVISSGNVLVDNLNTLSNAFVTVVDHTASPTIVEQVTGDFGNFLRSVVVWQKAIKATGLTQCPFWVANPNSTPTVPPTPTPTPTVSLTDSEEQLANQLNSNVLTGCTGRPDLEGNGIIAAVNCRPVEAGPTLRPLVVQFTDISSAQQWFSNNTARFADGNDCADGELLGTWNHNGVTAGMLGCADENGGLRIVWVIDTGLIGVIADGTDSSALYGWWMNSAYLISGS